MIVEGGMWDLVAQSPHTTGRRQALDLAGPHSSLSHGSLILHFAGHALLHGSLK